MYTTLRGKVNARCTRMPEGKRFQPGQSGNPSGRPSAVHKALKDAVKGKLEAVEHRSGKTNLERLLDTQYRRAMQGKDKCAEMFFAYCFGKPVQQQVSVNREVTRDDRVAGMSDEEMDRRLLELTGLDYKALKGERGPVQ